MIQPGWLDREVADIKARAKTWPRWLQGDQKAGQRTLVVFSSEKDRVEGERIIRQALDKVGISTEHIGDY